MFPKEPVTTIFIFSLFFLSTKFYGNEETDVVKSMVVVAKNEVCFQPIAQLKLKQLFIRFKK